mgnify:CR=1 FL=1
MNPPRLIVGLGNPGPEYEATRHNVGFWFVDRLADKLKLTLAPQGKFFGKAGRAGETCLLEPTTFMNRSGQSVAALANFYKIEPGEILAIHDALDLPPAGIPRAEYRKAKKEADKAAKVKALLTQYPMRLHVGPRTEKNREFCNRFYEALRTASPTAPWRAWASTSSTPSSSTNS